MVTIAMISALNRPHEPKRHIEPMFNNGMT